MNDLPNPSTRPLGIPRARRFLRLPVLLPLVVLVVLAAGCCVWPWACRNGQAGTADAGPWQEEAGRLRDEVRVLTEDFGPRYYFEQTNMARCREFIRSRLAGAGAEVEEQEYQVKGRILHNIRAFFGDRKQPRVVVGAHYDSCQIGDRVNPGADDNASGVAGLFGLARMLQNERPQGVCVELVAFSSEEPPFFGTMDMGSYRHAELLHREKVEVRGVLILEMIGYFKDEPGTQTYPLPGFGLMYPKVGNFIAVVGGMPDRGLISTCKQAMRGAAPLPVISTTIPRSWRMVHLSDHRNYWPFGYRSVMITDTAFYRNPNYHQPTDTWDTLDYVRMAQVVAQTHQAVMRLGR